MDKTYCYILNSGVQNGQRQEKEPQMTVFLVSRTVVKDPVKYQQYAQAAGPTITAHGGRIVSRGALDRALVGATEPHGTAVIEFPDMQTMEAWFASKDYQALVPVRDEGCEMQLLAYDQPTS